MTGGFSVGGLAGGNEGTISACYTTGNASGVNDVGGLVGNNDGVISACYATGNATGTGSSVGGLVGSISRSSPTITACYATGSVTGNGNGNVGGLVGEVYYSSITACYATSSVTGNGNGNVGGLVGEVYYSSITACYATGNVSATGTGVAAAGGLVGANSVCRYRIYHGGVAAAGGLVGEKSGGTIRVCYSIGNVTSTSASTVAGGLVGFDNGTARLRAATLTLMYLIDQTRTRMRKRPLSCNHLRTIVAYMRHGT